MGVEERVVESIAYLTKVTQAEVLQDDADMGAAARCREYFRSLSRDHVRVEGKEK